jgi:hypothetical protein
VKEESRSGLAPKGAPGLSPNRPNSQCAIGSFNGFGTASGANSTFAGESTKGGVSAAGISRELITQGNKANYRKKKTLIYQLTLVPVIP